MCLLLLDYCREFHTVFFSFLKACSGINKNALSTVTVNAGGCSPQDNMKGELGTPSHTAPELLTGTMATPGNASGRGRTVYVTICGRAVFSNIYFNFSFAE